MSGTLPIHPELGGGPVRDDGGGGGGDGYGQQSLPYRPPALPPLATPSPHPQHIFAPVTGGGEDLRLRERTNSSDTLRTTGTGYSWSYEKAIANSSIEEQRRKPPMSHLLPWRKNKRPANGSEAKLGTLAGVFLPCISQILGVIFFLRLPTITAQAGCIGTTVIIAVCSLSTFVTSLSLSAIATNGTIQAGGPYYIISRTLGVEVGGSLGLLFYLGTTLSASMYVLGAVETLKTNLDYYGKPAEQAQVEELDDLVAYYEIFDDDNEAEEYVDPNEIDEEEWWGMTQIGSLVTMLIITAMVSAGMKYVNLSATFFLSTTMLSIISILLGTLLFASSLWQGSLSSSDRVSFDNLWPHFGPDAKTGVTPTFTSLLALFFPSVTGIMAGTNRSAKLRKPSKSIPKGTIGAIAVTTSIYIVQVWLVGCVVAHQSLMENKLILATLAFPSKVAVKFGIIASCIGAALQCLTGAPQLLAAIAVDDAIPALRFFRPARYKTVDGGVVEQQTDPKAAIWATYLLASLACLVGNLDHITPIISMFYLLIYGGVNLCCFLLGWANAPGFRPTFRYYHKSISLFGFCLCLFLALFISWFMAFVAIGLFIFNYYYIIKMKQGLVLELSMMEEGGAYNDGGTRGTDNWGDVGDSLRYKITMLVLMYMTENENLHAKNWRPQLLTIVDTNDAGVPTHSELIALAAQLRKGRGLNVILTIKKGNIMKPGAYDAQASTRQSLREYMRREEMHGFAQVAVTHQDFSDAVVSAVTHCGIGPISPNVVMMSWLIDWRERPDKVEELGTTIKSLQVLRKAIVLFKGSASFPRRGELLPSGIIDIYWVVEEGGLCLLLPHLISMHKTWKNAELRIFAVATGPNENLLTLEKSVIDYCESVRIKASVNVVDLSQTTIATDMTNVDPKSFQHRMTISRALTQDLSQELTPSFNPSNSELPTEKDGEDPQVQTAKIFNNVIRFHSHTSNLVVTNMPMIESFASSNSFFAYIDRLSMCVDNIMLVRGSEYDVVTTVV